MTKIYKPPFAQTQQTGVVTVTDATPALIATAGANGAIFTKLSAIPAGTASATRLRLLLSKDSGVTKLPIAHALMAEYTESITVAATVTVFTEITEDTPIRLKAGDQLYVESSTVNANGVTFFAQSSDY